MTEHAVGGNSERCPALTSRFAGRKRALKCAGGRRISEGVRRPHPATQPAGPPLLVQAGASEAGRDFAAQYADAVFTAHQYLPDARVSATGAGRRVHGQVVSTRAADGFNVMAQQLPAGLEVFVEYAGPVLRRRGLFRTSYKARSLRGHYEIPRPGGGPLATLSLGWPGWPPSRLPQPASDPRGTAAGDPASVGPRQGGPQRGRTHPYGVVGSIWTLWR
jgi:hypothetical protein